MNDKQKRIRKYGNLLLLAAWVIWVGKAAPLGAVHIGGGHG